MGLHSGEISIGDHPHQHATTANTTSATDGSHPDRLWTRG